jgi:hypothetical protein
MFARQRAPEVLVLNDTGLQTGGFFSERPKDASCGVDLRLLTRMPVQNTLAADSSRPRLNPDVQRPADIERAPFGPIKRRAPGDAIPLSFGQRHVWLRAQLAGELPLYNASVTLHRLGECDHGIVERAFNEIVRRHESWRTSLDAVRGEPAQVVHPFTWQCVPLIDLQHLPGPEAECEYTRLCAAMALRPLGVQSYPLVRAQLVRLSATDHRLDLVLHQLIFDGFSSSRVFLTEFTALYEAFAAGKQPNLDELAIQYGDYACWQRQNHGTGGLDEAQAFWALQLAAPLPVLELPTDRPRRPNQSFSGAQYVFQLPEKAV